MNILILNWRDVSHPKSGGAEAVTMEHARRWVRGGHSVTWFTSSFSGAVPDETVDGVKIIRRSGSLRVYLLAPIYLMTHRDYDVVVDEIHGIPFFSPLFTRKPVIAFIHEIAGEIWDFMYPFPINVIGKMLERWYFRIYRHCRFWTDAPSMVDELVAHGIPREQCVSIPCPITDQNVPKKAYKKEQRPTYIFVSRVVKMKGIEEVIKAFSFIVREQPDAKLWIVGSGEKRYIDELQDMLMEYGVAGQTVFWGKVPTEKKYELMARAHILLHASVKEGWGLVVLEAASVGTPAVVYDVTGLKDVVKHDRTGFVLSDNNPHRLARESVKLLSDPKRYSRYKLEGIRWVSNLEWSLVASDSLDMLSSAVSRDQS